MGYLAALIARGAALLALAGAGLLLGGCAAPGELVLYNVGSADPVQPGTYVNASPQQARQGLRISRDGQPLAIEVPMRLAKGDVVETLPQTIAVIRFADGHQGTLLPETRVRLGSFFVWVGKLFVQVFGQEPGTRFKVSTNYVTAGVEGTEFWVRVSRDETLSLGVVAGRVSLASQSGHWQPVPVLPDEVATVVRDDPPKKSQTERASVDAIVQLMRGGLRLKAPGLPPAPPRPPAGLPRAP